MDGKMIGCSKCEGGEEREKLTSKTGTEEVEPWQVAAGPGGGGLGPASRSLTESLMVPEKGPVGESRAGGGEEEKCSCIEEKEEWMEGEESKGFWMKDCTKVPARAVEKRRRREGEALLEKLAEKNKDGKVKSTEVPKDLVQDYSMPMMIVGCDVEQLYPSLEMRMAAKLVEEAILQSKVRWKDLEYMEGARMVAMNRSEEWLRQEGLDKIIPKRRKKGGTAPGVTGKDPTSRNVGCQEQWVFPEVVLTEEEKRKILAAVIRVAVEVLFSSHLYTFGGKTFLQKEGGPIGLRATCAVARLVMHMWDQAWLGKMKMQGVDIEEYARYMDDGRVFMFCIKRGWRWTEGELVWKRDWAKEDEGRSLQEVTKAAVDRSMQEVYSFLRFTTETGNEFEDGWLPTLDISLRVEEETGEVKWKFFEKPTTARTTVQSRSAMGGLIKTQILANDLVRRLLNTKEDLPKAEIEKVVDAYTAKLERSGHSRSKIIEIAVAGIRGYEKKVRRRKKEGKPLFRTSQESLYPRQMKKILGAKSWYRRKRKAEEEDEPGTAVAGLQGGNRRECKKRRLEWDPNKEEGRRMPTRSVLFVEFSEDSLLAKRMKETMDKLEGIIGCKVKVVERSGTPISRLFPLTRLWEGVACAREDCVTCQQGGERIYACNLRSLTYQNICLVCHPGGGEKVAKLNAEVSVPGVYIGESARSLYERGREHWKGFRERREDSHIWKHQVLHHGGDTSSKFHLRPMEYHRTALNRQLSEAVKIGRFGEENLLNSKGEYNRSRIARLSLGEMVEERKPLVEVDKEEEDKDQARWEGEKSINIQRKSQKEWRQKNPLKKTTSRKKREDDLDVEEEEIIGKTTKRRKFDLIEEGCWGEGRGRLVRTPGIPQPYLPLQRRVVGRRRKIRGGNTTVVRNDEYASTDIRHFITRAVVHNSQPVSNENCRQPAFVESEDQGLLRKDELKNDEEDKEDDGKLSPGRKEDEKTEEKLEENIKKKTRSTPPSDQDYTEEEDFSQLFQTPNKIVQKSMQSAHLGLRSSVKKRGRELEEDCEEETPSKKMNVRCQEDYEVMRGRKLSSLFGEEEQWCKECVMMPCVCLLNKVELRIMEEKIRRLSSQRTTTPPTKTSPTTTTPLKPPETTTTTGDNNVGLVAYNNLEGGLDCSKEKDVKLLSARKEETCQILRGPGRNNTNSATTTTPKGRRITMKAKNSSNKKVVRMTGKEKEETRRTTRDIRDFLRMGEERKEEAVGSSLVQRLIRAAEQNTLSTTTTMREVSGRNTCNNPCLPSLSKPNNKPVVDVRTREGETVLREGENCAVRRGPSISDVMSSEAVSVMRGKCNVRRGPSNEEPVVPDIRRGGLRGGDDDDPDNLGQGRGNVSTETKPNEVLMIEVLEG